MAMIATRIGIVDLPKACPKHKTPQLVCPLTKEVDPQFLVSLSCVDCVRGNSLVQSQMKYCLVTYLANHGSIESHRHINYVDSEEKLQEWQRWYKGGGRQVFIQEGKCQRPDIRVQGGY